jgi:MYXO-CTERM domain-containing protein
VLQRCPYDIARAITSCIHPRGNYKEEVFMFRSMASVLFATILVMCLAAAPLAQTTSGGGQSGASATQPSGTTGGGSDTQGSTGNSGSIGGNSGTMGTSGTSGTSGMGGNTGLGQGSGANDMGNDGGRAMGWIGLLGLAGLLGLRSRRTSTASGNLNR